MNAQMLRILEGMKHKDEAHLSKVPEDTDVSDMEASECCEEQHCNWYIIYHMQVKIDSKYSSHIYCKHRTAPSSTKHLGSHSEIPASKS